MAARQLVGLAWEWTTAQDIAAGLASPWASQREEILGKLARPLPRRADRGEAGFGDLAADCAARLRVRLARPQREAGDW